MTAAPYYSDDLVTLYLGDCRYVRYWLDADVLVTDPPYGVGYTTARRRNEHGAWISGAARRATGISGDRTTALRDEALTLWGDSRPALCFGSWRASRPADVKQRLIWDKGAELTAGNLRLPWAATDEEIYVMGKWPPLTPGGRRAEGGTPARGPSVLRVPKIPAGAKSRPAHPTPKPAELLVQLIGKCPPGIIADPFAGAGSTLLAARQLGRRCIGVEIDEAYCELIATRLTAARNERAA